MNCQEFLEQHRINYAYIFVKIVNGKKQLQTYKDVKNTLPPGWACPFICNSYNDLNKITFEDCRKYQNLAMFEQVAKMIDAQVFIAHSCNKYSILDIDTQDFNSKELCSKTPYYLSSVKQLPHIFWNANGDKNIGFYSFGELLYSWSWMSLNTVVENAHLPIADLDLECIKPWLKKELIPRFKIEPKTELPEIKDLSIFYDTIEYKLCSLLNTQRWDDRSDWIKIAMILKGRQPPVGVPTFYCVWRHWSQQSSKFVRDNFEPGGSDYNVWKSLNPTRITIASLHRMAKMDNEVEYNNIFDTSYRAQKELFELSNFYIEHPSVFVRISQEGDMTLHKYASFYQAVCPLTFTEQVVKGYDKSTGEAKYKTVQSNFFKRWNNDKTRRSYTKFVFELHPDYNNKYNYNRFNGFRVEEFPSTELTQDLDKVLEFIKVRLCNNNEEYNLWFLNWLANIFKTPWNKTRVVPIFKSVQGTGKNLFFDTLIGGIIGQQCYVSTSRGDDILGRFNKLLEDKIFVVYNEAESKCTFERQSSFKSLITDTTMTIEVKGIDSCSYNNYLNFVILTNQDCVVNIEPSDRRFSVIEMNCPKLTDQEAHLYVALFQDQRVQSMFYQHLRESPLYTNNDLENTRVFTQFYMDMQSKLESQEVSFIRWWTEAEDSINCINYSRRRVVDKDGKTHSILSNQGSTFIPTHWIIDMQSLYVDYKDWKNMNAESCVLRTYKQFFFAIKKMKDVELIPRDNTENYIRERYKDVKIPIPPMD